MIGTIVDKYEVLQKIGEGGMATVYRGRHTTLERDVAIKILHPHLSSSTRNRKRFAREARAIEHLRHPNILEIFDYSGIGSGDCYIITEYVHGHTLTELLEEHGPLASELVTQIGLSLCDALGYAHAAGVLHRDIKPDNVMVRCDGTIKLMDFGIARFLDESQVTLTGALVGSPAFMSPEQATEAPLGTRSDLFSLGTVLFYLVTGRYPFTGSNPSLILKKVIEGDRPHVSELAPAVSPTLADVIERLMSTSPEARFDSAEATAEALRVSLTEVGIRPEDPAWSLGAWLDDPAGWAERATAQATDALLRLGREALDAGDPLAALRQFNRLLAMDEDNAEVLALIEQLHAEPEPEPPPGGARAPWWIGIAAVGALLAVVTWALTPPTASGPPPPPTTVAVIDDPVPPPPPPPPAPAPPTSIEAPAVTAAPEAEVPERPLRDRPLVKRPVMPMLPRPQPPPSSATTSPAPPALDDTPGRLVLRSRIPADVFHEGQRIGTTRLPLQLEPGSYVLELRSDVIETREIRVAIGPGDDIQREVMVQPKPAPVRLATDVDDACEVWLDDTLLGTAGALGHTFSVPRPDQPGHQLRLDCPEQPTFVHTWSGVVLPGEVVRP